MSLEIKSITTTVTTAVLSGEGYLSAEIDSRPWGHNGGKTTFFKGDNCYVIVYKSTNVSELQSYTSNDTTLEKASSTVSGYNVHREGISFTTPVASSSKPLYSGVTVLESKFSNGVGGIQYMSGYTTLRATKWAAQLDINGSKPFGFVFIEYTPKAELWAFKGLEANPKLISTVVHGTIYGIAKALEISFNSL